MSSSRNVIAPANQPLQLPFQVGNTLQRPSSPPNGFLRVNSQTNYIEVYYNNNWASIIYIGTLATAAITDPYFMYNILLLTGAGITNSQNNTFIDSSPNNFTITRNGNSTQGSFSPYKVNWSNYFNGSTDYFSAPSNAAFTLGTGDFTVECWVYPTATYAVAPGNAIGGNYIAGAGNDGTYWVMGISVTGNIYIGGRFTTLITSTGTVPLNTWTHIAISRQSGTSRAFINGTLSGTSTTVLDFSSTATMYVGAVAPTAGFANWPGYISNFRVVKGTALYTFAFIPQTLPLQATSTTSLLTCQSNRTIDNSSNVFTLTPVGTMSVQPFSPFTITAPYSTTTTGGSGYFDGTGDYLANTLLSSSLTIGGSDFCIEAWGYWTSFNSGTYGSPIIALYGATSQIMLRANKTAGASTSFNLYSYISSGGTFVPAAGYSSGISAGTIYLNQWTHVAVSRQGSTWRMFVNGQIVNTQTDATSFAGALTAFTLASDPTPANGLLTGWMTNARVVAGNAIYTSNFTPPTSQLTLSDPPSSTFLLCKFTNGGIIDNAMMLNSETQANATISTTQARFGQSSMFFNGTSTLSIPFTPLLNFNAGNFTIEFWTYVTVAPSAEQYFVSVGPAGGGGVNRGWRLAAHDGTTAGIYLFASGVSGNTLLGSFPSINAWHHIAIVRNGTTITGYVDGIPLNTNVNASTTAITDIVAGDYSFVGALQGTAPTGRFFYNGYIQDFRITKGFARYTANFTPPTQALPTY